MASPENAPSLITTPQLRYLWNDVQSNPGNEFTVTRFWTYLLREVFGFSGPNWNISPEQPPTGHGKDRERVDLQVEYFETSKEEFRVLVFFEGKAHGATQTQYDVVEHQAYRDCLEYMNSHKLKEIYAVTVVGTAARVWKCEPISYYLDPLFKDESKALSDMKAYLETNSTDGPRLREQFAFIKEKAGGNRVHEGQPGRPASVIPSQH